MGLFVRVFWETVSRVIWPAIVTNEPVGEKKEEKDSGKQTLFFFRTGTSAPRSIGRPPRGATTTPSEMEDEIPRYCPHAQMYKYR